MRVGMLIDELASGSAPKTIGQGVKGLRSLHYDAEAVVIKSGYSSTYAFHMDGVPIRSISDSFPPVRILDTRFPGFSFFSLHHLTSAMASPFLFRKNEWDMVVCFGAYTCFTAMALKKTRGIPYLAFMATEPFTYILRRVYSEKPLGKVLPLLMPFAAFLQEYVLRDCAAVIVFSRTYTDLVREFSSKPIEILPPGCFPIPILPSKRENFILTYDRWDVGNTPHFFLDILPKLRMKVGLVVAGHWYPESIEESFVKEVKRRKLEDQVTILGALNEKEIIDLCSRAAVHVHPNKEAFGMQTLEAAACGCPIIVPEGSGVAELFQAGRDGYFPVDRDVDSFVDAIDKVLAGPEKAEVMGRNAWEVAKEYTWQAHAKRLAQIIQKYKYD